MDKQQFVKWFFEKDGFWPTPEQIYDKLMGSESTNVYYEWWVELCKENKLLENRIKQLENGIKEAMQIRAIPYGAGDYEILKELISD